MNARDATLAGFSRPRRLACLGAAAAMIFLLFYLGAKPVAVNLFPEPWDKVAHLVVYGAMAALLACGSPRRRPVQIVLLVAAIGALDEWHQVSLPGRSADVGDFIADAVAAIVVVTLLDRLLWRRTAPAATDRP